MTKTADIIYELRKAGFKEAADLIEQLLRENAQLRAEIRKETAK